MLQREGEQTTAEGGGQHAGDCQPSPGATVGELGLGQGRQQLLPQP